MASSSSSKFAFILSRERKNIMRFSLLQDKTKVGMVRFSLPISPLTKSAYLHKIEIEKPFRNRHLGTILLNKMDVFLLENSSVENITGMLWDNQSNLYLKVFFINNGYDLKENEASTYDNGEQIIDCIPFFKSLNK
jgi:hypothetical protein